MSGADGTGSDLLDLLAADHRRIRRLVAEDADVPTLRRELSAHLVAEAHLLYPEARRSVYSVDQLVDDLLDADHVLEEALVDLDRHDEAAARGRVQELAVRHVDRQEDELFPRLRADADPRRLVALGDALGEVVSQAPSHAHPNLPDEGSLSVIADALAARFDELRDAYREGREGKDGE